MDLREGNRSYDTLKATYKGHQITISWSALISSRYLIILYATHADDTNFPQVTKYFLCQVWILKRLLTLFGDIQYIFAIHFSINVFSIRIRIQSFSQNSIFEKSFDICLSYFLFFFYLHITFWKIYSNLDAIEKNILLIAWKKIELSFQKNRQWNIQQ